MNTMSMPGFTAEASLHKASEHYQWISNPSAEAGKRGVIPQRVGPPIGTPGQTHIPLSCAAFNGLQLPPVVIKGPTGGQCAITSTLSNCKPATGGGCTCDTTVSKREGDCGD
jgi:hypothetical protein